jgi:hypothetical protein
VTGEAALVVVGPFLIFTFSAVSLALSFKIKTFLRFA